MSYQKFKNQVVDCIGAKYPDALVKVIEVYKTNGIVLDGLVIVEKEFDAAPTIYLNDYYSTYVKDGKIDIIIDAIVNIYEHRKYQEGIDMWSLANLKVAKNNILAKLINTKRNVDLLHKVPSVQVLDLSMVFYVNMNGADESSQTHVLIHNELLSIWDIDLETLVNIAKENTIRKYSSYLKGMNEIIGNILGHTEEQGNRVEKNIDEFEGEENHDFDNCMFVLSNCINTFGAILMTYKNVLDEVKNKIGKNYYILPSSLHELILVPEHEDVEVERLRAMVCEVNKEVLEVEDYLSDSVYFYDGEEVREV